LLYQFKEYVHQGNTHIDPYGMRSGWLVLDHL
jgi:hypothetical protein